MTRSPGRCPLGGLSPAVMGKGLAPANYFNNRLDGRLPLEQPALHTLCAAAEGRPRTRNRTQTASPVLVVSFLPVSLEAGLRTGHGFRDVSASVVFFTWKARCADRTPAAL